MPYKAQKPNIINPKIFEQVCHLHSRHGGKFRVSTSR